MLSEVNLKKFEDLKKRYPTTKALTLPLLWLIQEQDGWISQDSMKYAAELLQMPLSHVYGVVTFYTMFNTKPVGKYHIQICTNVSCQLRGSAEIVDQVCNRLHLKFGEMAKDNRFSINEVECLGSCGTAPMMQVNDDYYEDLTVEKVNHLLDKFSKK